MAKQKKRLRKSAALALLLTLSLSLLPAEWYAVISEHDFPTMGSEAKVQEV